MKDHPDTRAGSHVLRRRCCAAAAAAVLWSSYLPGVFATDSGASAAGTAMSEAMKDSMTGMQDMKMSGNPDRDFAMLMKMHHEGAVKMAEVELKHGKDPKLRHMARDIIAAQKKEIKEFDQWLSRP